VIELVVNADDFGHSELTNDGIVRAREHGIVTSTSLMVRRPGAEHAAEYARGAPDFGVGLHVDFGPWETRDGDVPRVAPRAPVADEVRAQLERFRELVGRDPTHIDSHHHVHRDEPVGPVARALAARLGVPLRFHGGARYVEGFYGSPDSAAIELRALLSIIEGLDEGLSEIGCHPGLDAELDSSYRVERLREVAVLCDPRAREALERGRVVLRSF
jgi:chitin disaccharide deacetylase